MALIRQSLGIQCGGRRPSDVLPIYLYLTSVTQQQSILISRAEKDRLLAMDLADPSIIVVGGDERTGPLMATV